jgi:hypothetical protein
MRRRRTQAHENDVHHMLASIGIGIGIDLGGYFDADAESDPDADSDPDQGFSMDGNALWPLTALPLDP